MPNLHSLIVHFPVALLTVAFVADFVAVVFRKEEARSVGWWVMVAGYTSLVGSVISGLLAKEVVLVPVDAGNLFERHQQAAFAAAALFSALFLWRIGARSNIPPARFLYLFLLGVALAILWAGAWFGGRLVFQFGVGVSGV